MFSNIMLKLLIFSILCYIRIITFSGFNRKFSFLQFFRLPKPNKNTWPAREIERIKSTFFSSRSTNTRRSARDRGSRE